MPNNNLDVKIQAYYELNPKSIAPPQKYLGLDIERYADPETPQGAGRIFCPIKLIITFKQFEMILISYRKTAKASDSQQRIKFSSKVLHNIPKQTLLNNEMLKNQLNLHNWIGWIKSPFSYELSWNPICS